MTLDLHLAGKMRIVASFHADDGTTGPFCSRLRPMQSLVLPPTGSQDAQAPHVVFSRRCEPARPVQRAATRDLIRAPGQASKTGVDRKAAEGPLLGGAPIQILPSLRTARGSGSRRQARRAILGLQ
jgi:hypothetical protein